MDKNLNSLNEEINFQERTMNELTRENSMENTEFFIEKAAKYNICNDLKIENFSLKESDLKIW
jgi:hypothetical protein